MPLSRATWSLGQLSVGPPGVHLPRVCIRGRPHHILWKHPLTHGEDALSPAEVHTVGTRGLLPSAACRAHPGNGSPLSSLGGLQQLLQMTQQELRVSSVVQSTGLEGRQCLVQRG